MRFCYWAMIPIMLLLVCPQLSSAQGYSIEELSSEGTAAVRPFSIGEVAAVDGGLRLFINTYDPEVVAGLLGAGTLQGQLSDHEAETEASVQLSLGEAVWCTSDGEAVFQSYGDPLPVCNGNPPVRIEYFIDASAVLGPGRDLALGQDPDFLWLIEEQ